MYMRSYGAGLLLVFLSALFVGCSQEEKPVAEGTVSRPNTEYAGEYATVSQDRANQLGCSSCHEGIEDIRDIDSTMMQMIIGLGQSQGDPNGCVVCHGGTPGATTFKEAHQGSPAGLVQAGGPKEFYSDPGSMWMVQYTCGQRGCHPNYPYRLELALMTTEAGKIQGNLHTWGIEDVQDYRVPWGNYDVTDTDGPAPLIGTEAYKAYMQDMVKVHPKQFPAELKQVPQPSVDEIEADPKLAGFTYQRQQCQRCHVSVRGREKRGDYRGMGCSACHVLYSNEGFYEGNDPTIDKEEQGHLLTHKIYGTREADNGVPVETCNSCHNRGKRIGVTYQGLMEFPYGTPFAPDGSKQPKLHTKQYLFISDDLHHQIESRPGNPRGGMLCQDCHTTVDIHGDGNIFGTTLAQVEIECQDCHGTPEKYPWELPLGYSEEFDRELADNPRGLADKALYETTYFGTPYDKKDGYLLTNRGNPFGNVVKDGDKVVLHSATGNDFEVPVLRTLQETNGWKSPDAMVAMAKVKKHADRLECYTCHASWVPQCYGCHVKMDYSSDADGNPLADIDWVASGSQHTSDGQTAESRLGTGGIKSPGKTFEGRSYLRWEEPVLGINGEGRVTPLMPGCQVVWTVVGRDGKTVVQNVISRSADEARAIGQDSIPLALDMAPVQPHSVQRPARTCESCHNNPKAMGYGIANGIFQSRHTEDVVEDLIDQRTGKPIPQRYQVQIPAIPELDFDWSTIVDRDGKQLATVGTHWPLSRALNNRERQAMERTGLCMGCHREMPNKALWNKVNTPGSLTDTQHIELMNKMLKAYHEASSQAQ